MSDTFPVTVELGSKLPAVPVEPPPYSVVVCQNSNGYLWTFYRTQAGWNAGGDKNNVYTWKVIYLGFTVLAIFKGRT